MKYFFVWNVQGSTIDNDDEDGYDDVIRMVTLMITDDMTNPISFGKIHVIQFILALCFAFLHLYVLLPMTSTLSRGQYYAMLWILQSEFSPYSFFWEQS